MIVFNQISWYCAHQTAEDLIHVPDCMLERWNDPFTWCDESEELLEAVAWVNEREIELVPHLVGQHLDMNCMEMYYRFNVELRFTRDVDAVEWMLRFHGVV